MRGSTCSLVSPPGRPVDPLAMTHVVPQVVPVDAVLVEGQQLVHRLAPLQTLAGLLVVLVLDKREDEVAQHVFVTARRPVPVRPETGGQ